MSIHRPSILGWGQVPDPTNGLVFPEPYDVKATNGKWKHLTWVFEDGSTKDGLRFFFPVPSTYVNGAKFILVWTSIVITNDVEWDIDYRAVGGNDSESFDQATAQQSLNVADTAPGAINRRMETILTPTAGNFLADDSVEIEVFRDKVDAGDTLVGAALLKDVLFEFSDA